MAWAFGRLVPNYVYTAGMDVAIFLKIVPLVDCY